MSDAVTIVTAVRHAGRWFSLYLRGRDAIASRSHAHAKAAKEVGPERDMRVLFAPLGGVTPETSGFLVAMRLANESFPAISTHGSLRKPANRTQRTELKPTNSHSFLGRIFFDSSFMLFPSVCSDGVVITGGEAGFSVFFSLGGNSVAKLEAK
jgi:hypothetical protein